VLIDYDSCCKYMTKVVKNGDLAPKTGLILREVGEGMGEI
jgi:hypothetical protein